MQNGNSGSSTNESLEARKLERTTQAQGRVWRTRDVTSSLSCVVSRQVLTSNESSRHSMTLVFTIH